MTIAPQGLVQQPGQGTSYWFDRDLYPFKAVGEDTGEAYALCEVVVSPTVVAHRLIGTVGKMNHLTFKRES